MTNMEDEIELFRFWVVWPARHGHNVNMKGGMIQTSAALLADETGLSSSDDVVVISR